MDLYAHLKVFPFKKKYELWYEPHKNAYIKKIAKRNSWCVFFVFDALLYDITHRQYRCCWCVLLGYHHHCCCLLYKYAPEVLYIHGRYKVPINPHLSHVWCDVFVCVWANRIKKCLMWSKTEKYHEYNEQGISNPSLKFLMSS